MAIYSVQINEEAQKENPDQALIANWRQARSRLFQEKRDLHAATTIRLSGRERSTVQP